MKATTRDDRDARGRVHEAARVMGETVEPLRELSSSALDEDPWLTPDRTMIFFASERSGNDELY